MDLVKARKIAESLKKGGNPSPREASKPKPAGKKAGGAARGASKARKDRRGKAASPSDRPPRPAPLPAPPEAMPPGAPERRLPPPQAMLPASPAIGEPDVTEDHEVADFDPDLHFVDFQAERRKASIESATKPTPSPRVERASPAATPRVVRDAREDPQFADLLKPRPRDEEVVALLDRADENPEFPRMDVPSPEQPLVSSPRRTPPSAAATGPGYGTFDEIWEDEEARLLGLVEEELFRRAYGEERKQETEGEKLIGFQLAGEYYAVSILVVAEIIKTRPITPVPRSPAYVSGIICLRGAMIPVVDLRCWLGLAENPLGRGARILVLKREGLRIGFIVDHVLGVTKIPAETIEPPPGAFRRIDAEFIRNVGRLGGRFYVLLNPDRLFRIEDVESSSLEARS